jgi:DnaJ like chaperone protein
MRKSIYSGGNEKPPDEQPTQFMASLAQIMTPFFAMPEAKAIRQDNTTSARRLESVAFTHALVALAAKLATIDGAPNKAEYAAFHALFVESDGAEAAQLRSLFVKRVTDTSPALQYAREIARMTAGQSALHHDLMSRLLRIATADAALNAAELELLRAIADVLGIAKETFRALVSQTMAPAGASPYTILGVSPHADDAELRTHYMTQVQKLHPDRYHAAGASTETVTMLSDQLAAVNAAYQTVQKLRAKKSTLLSHGSWWGRRNTKGAKADSA